MTVSNRRRLFVHRPRFLIYVHELLFTSTISYLRPRFFIYVHDFIFTSKIFHLRLRFSIYFHDFSFTSTTSYLRTRFLIYVYDFTFTSTHPRFFNSVHNFSFPTAEHNPLLNTRLPSHTSYTNHNQQMIV